LGAIKYRRKLVNILISTDISDKSSLTYFSPTRVLSSLHECINLLSSLWFARPQSGRKICQFYACDQLVLRQAAEALMPDGSGCQFVFVMRSLSFVVTEIHFECTVLLNAHLKISAPPLLKKLIINQPYKI
jgi:hypothetical protein